MKLSARDRRAVTFGAAALGVILILRLGLIPWLGSWRQARIDMSQTRAELGELGGQMDRLMRIRQRLTETYGPGAANPLPDVEAARIGLPKTISDMLKAGGLGVGSITPQPPHPLREVPGVELLCFQVKGRCKLPQLAKSLAEMQKAESLVFVERLIAIGDEKKPGQLDVTLILGTLARQRKVGS